MSTATDIRHELHSHYQEIRRRIENAPKKERVPERPAPVVGWSYPEPDPEPAPSAPASRQLSTFETYVKAVCLHYGISKEDFFSTQKTADRVLPRQISRFLLKEDEHWTWHQIARRMGMDHTTILHSYRNIKERFQSTPAIAADIEAIRARIRSMR